MENLKKEYQHATSCETQEGIECGFLHTNRVNCVQKTFLAQKQFGLLFFASLSRKNARAVYISFMYSQL